MFDLLIFQMDNTSEEEVRVLILNEDEHKTEELFRLKKGLSRKTERNSH